MCWPFLATGSSWDVFREMGRPRGSYSGSFFGPLWLIGLVSRCFGPFAVLNSQPRPPSSRSLGPQGTSDAGSRGGDGGGARRLGWRPPHRQCSNPPRQPDSTKPPTSSCLNGAAHLITLAAPFRAVQSPLLSPPVSFFSLDAL